MHEFEVNFSQSWPVDRWKDAPTLLAVSGGADSIALLRAMVSLSDVNRLIVGHLNHGLRGEESLADENFVSSLAAELGCKFFCDRTDVVALAEMWKVGIEEAARKARYRFLQETAECFGARYAVTAHTANDQAETILHRILRGTGPAGLAGIPRVRPLGPAVTVIRPMLQVTRSEVEAYLGDLGQSYRSDKSNSDRAFTRNRLRNELIPHLEQQYNTGVVEAVVRLGLLASEMQAVIERLAGELFDRAVKPNGSDTVVICCRSMVNCERYVVREVLAKVWANQQWPMQDMSFQHWQELTTQATSPVDKRLRPTVRTYPGNVRAQKQGEQLVLTRPAKSVS